MCIVVGCNRKTMRFGNYCRRHYNMIRQYGRVIDIRNPHDDNRIILHNDYAEVIITDMYDRKQGSAIIDKEDIPRIKGRHWSQNGNGYIRTFIKQKPLYLHRYLLGYDGDLDVDHINGDKLDNRKSNLRIVSHSINALNKKNASCVREVKERNLSKPFLATVSHNGKHILFKYFKTEAEAKEAVWKVKHEIGA